MNNDYIVEMLKDYLGQLAHQLPQYNQSQQTEVLDSVRALVMNPKPIAYGRPQEEVLADIREQIEDDGRAAVFFTTAFTNWYRRTQEPRVAHLHDYNNLDLGNRHLFNEMMSLRDSGRFDDESLYQFEQYCLDKMGE